MVYNPNIYHRKNIRLKGYDYSQAGLYFITLNIRGRKHLFGKIENKIMELNDFGIIAHQQWEKLPERYTNISLDVFQVMPNHMHGLILIKQPDANGNNPVTDDYTSIPGVGAGLAPAPVQYNAIAKDAARAGASPAPDGSSETKNDQRYCGRI